MAVGKTVRLRHRRDRVWVGGKIHARRFVRYGLHLSTSPRWLPPTQGCVSTPICLGATAILPAVDGGEGDADELRELGLRQAFRLADIFDFLRIVVWNNC